MSKRLLTTLSLATLTSISGVANAQTAQFTQQTTRVYTLPEITALSQNLNTIHDDEFVFCSNVDTTASPVTNTKRSFMLSNTGEVTQRTQTYNKNTSSSGDLDNNVIFNRLTANENTEQEKTDINHVWRTGSSLSPSIAGNIVSFRYNQESKVKYIVATTSGFYYSFNNRTYMKGC